MSKNTLGVVGRISDTGQLVVATDRFLEVLDDGTKIEEAVIARSDGRWYLRLRGTLKDGNCQAHSVPVDFTPDGDIEPAGDDSDADTCSGAPCTSCEIVREHGHTRCKCNGLSGSCNHTTTSIIEVLPRFLKQ